MTWLLLLISTPALAVAVLSLSPETEMELRVNHTHPTSSRYDRTTPLLWNILFCGRWRVGTRFLNLTRDRDSWNLGIYRVNTIQYEPDKVIAYASLETIILPLQEINPL